MCRLDRRTDGVTREVVSMVNRSLGPQRPWWNEEQVTEKEGRDEWL
jgi:hypothetical protein